jgi:hypothetical protein
MRAGKNAWAKGSAVAVRSRDWVDRQDPATRRGATIGWYRRFRESDGGLSTLIAVFDVLLFGMGFGRVLQVAHARSWHIDVGKPQFLDQARYMMALAAPLGLFLIYIVQTRVLHGQPSWIGWALAPIWILVLFTTSSGCRACFCTGGLGSATSCREPCSR